MSTWRRRFEPGTRRFFHTWWRLTRGMTLGVRVVATDTEGRVLLVEHTYIPGWHLPGGGVDRGETTGAAAARELMEEAGIRALSRPELVSIHETGPKFPGDHVLVYRVRTWEQAEEPGSRGEILRRGFFSPDDLPEGATRATRARLAEVFGGGAPDPRW